MKNYNQKQQSRNTMISLAIIIIMAISTLSYAVLNVFENQEKAQTTISEFIIKQNISEDLKIQYMRQGMTFLEVHYGYGTDIKSIEDLPNQFKTPYNEVQLVIIEITDYGNSFATIESLEGYEEVNSTDLNQIGKALCKVLLYPPVECIIDSLEINNSVSDQENSANTSYNATGNSSI